MYDIFDKAFDSIIKKAGNKFTISLSSKDDIQAVVDATAKMLKENKDTFVKIMTDAYDKVDVKDIIENTVDELVDKLASASGKMSQMRISRHLKISLCQQSMYPISK